MNRELLRRIDRLLEERELVLIAIDGSCAAGKSTLAAELAKRYDCSVIPMDDFFLRPCQRTPERYAEAGGNVDYERFADEVLRPLRLGQAFTYRPYDCRTACLSAPVTVQPKKLNIIEGSYSLHPYFGQVYDLRVFLTVSPALQEQRILERPAFLHEAFFQRWIPMEQRYFTECSIAQTSDLVI